MKIAFIYGNGFSSKLTKFFTGSRCYHVGIVDLDNDNFYDMNLLFRRRKWSVYAAKHREHKLVESPVAISRQYIEDLLSSSESTYGWVDYCLFALRPLYHLFGKSTRNMNGVICSELVSDILVANGWEKFFMEVPSPADLELALGVR